LFPELTNYLFLAAFLAPPFFLPPFFAAFFLVAILSFLLLSQGEDHKMLCCCSSCGQEKTAHNMLLYKLNSKACQQFITVRAKYFACQRMTSSHVSDVNRSGSSMMKMKSDHEQVIANAHQS